MVYWLLTLSFALHVITLGIISLLCFRLARDAEHLNRTLDRFSQQLRGF